MAVAPSCPSADELAGFVAGELAQDAAVALEAHLDACDSCRRGVSALVGAEHDESGDTLPASGPQGTAADLGHGERVGRFTLTRRLGSGAMGDVWAAHDPVLEREVALKLMRPHPELSGERATARMQREAQAMARLNHPNVVAVYDFGDAGDRVFCAMELVDGVTLRAWLATRHAWREVVPVVLAIGRGLAAAHAAGLVHRDIKPENVLLARDGRVLVTDFGLAMLDRTERRASSESVASDLLTTEGALVGTPAYMAPEQLDGGSVDALGDQFAYCVVVYEALFGARPFRAVTLAELRAAIGKGPPQPANPRGVPRRVTRAIARGLAETPAARWPSLEPLLAELTAATRRRRGWLALAGGVAVAGGVGLALVLGRPGGADAGAERRAAEQRIAAAWSPARRAELHAAFARSGHPLAASREASLATALDAYRDAWLAARLDAWAATHVRGEQQLDRLERELACFERLADQLAAFVTLLSRPLPAEVGRAPDLAYRLEPPASCRGARQAVAPSTPAGHALELRLRELEMLQVLGRHDEALAHAEAIVRDTGAAHDPALHARARHDYGITLANTGKFAEAAKELRAAVQEAADAHDQYLVAAIWVRLIAIEGLNLGHSAAAAELEPVARAAVALAGDDPRQLGDLEFSLGTVGYARSDLVGARAHFAASRARRVAYFGAEHPMVASTESNLGAMEMHLGNLDEATRILEHALSVTTTRLGGDHPLVGQIALNLAGIAQRRNDWPAAERHLRTSARVYTIVFPGGHPELAKVHRQLAGALREQKRYDDAAAELATAHAVLGKLPDPRETIRLELADAQLAEARGTYREAVRIARAAIAEMRADPNVKAADRAYALAELARMVAYEDPRAALPLYEEALEVHTSLPSRDESGDVATLTELANVALRAKRPEVARRWFDRMPKAAAQLADLRGRLK